MKYEQTQQINSSILKYIDIEQGGYPKLFKEAWDKMTEPRNEEQKPYQVYGQALHCYLLENDKFNERYYVSQLTEDQKYKKLDEFKNTNLTFEEIVGILCERYVISKDVKKEETKLKHYSDHSFFLQQFEYYFTCLKENKDKQEISQYDYDKIVQTYVNIQTHPVAKQYFDDSTESVSEYEITDVDYARGIKLKAKIDRYYPNNNIILDIKTTSKSVYQFKESFDKYKYDYQAAFYDKIINYTKGIDTNNIQNKFIFIVCSSYDSTIAVYEINKEKLLESKHKIDMILSIICGLFEKNEFKYFPFEFINNQPIELS